MLCYSNRFCPLSSSASFLFFLLLLVPLPTLIMKLEQPERLIVNFFGPSAVAGEGGLLLGELNLCAEVERQNIGESSVYWPSSKPSSGSCFLNAHLLNTLLLYHL